VRLNQSYHMTDLYLRGPDVIAFLSHVGVNSFAGFGRNKARQRVCVKPDGYVIGDGILFGLEDTEALYVGRPPLANWLAFQTETASFDVTASSDLRSLENTARPRRLYRFEVEGRLAMQVVEEANEGGPLTTKFFAMGEITVAGCHARTLAHGMGGVQGLELWGPCEEGTRFHARLLETGAAYGKLQAGARPIPVPLWNRAGSPRPCPRTIPGQRCSLVASGCPPPGSRFPALPAAVSRPKMWLTAT